ncbi:MAG: a-factor receptor [Bathelium mastoideum]|nr:MAG: a-factor receptor [Bathelium mastoideum]
MDTATSIFPIYASAIVLAVFSLLNVLLDLPPFIFHLGARNVAASSLILWIILMNLFDLVNALLWPTDDISKWFSGTGLCDVEVKLFVGAQVGQLGALICIMQELARVLDTQNVTLGRTSSEEKRRKVWELVVCWGMPVLLMLSHYIVQPARYSIFGVSGCTVMVDNSWPAIVLVQIWPAIFALVDVYYSGVVVYRIHRYRKEFSSLLSASNTSKSRFLRLFLMALALTVVFFPLTLYLFYYNVNIAHIPFSWEKIHDQEAWGEIVMVPGNGSVFTDHWIRVATGVLVFVFFGMGSEAMQMYRSALLAIGLGKIFPRLQKGRNSTSPSGSTSSFGSRAKVFIRGKLSRRGAAATVSTVQTPTSAKPKSVLPAFHKIKAWYIRFFHRRHHQDDDRNMQLPMWNPSSPTQPDSPSSTVRPMHEGEKEMIPLGPSSAKDTAGVHSFEIEVEDGLRKG